MDEITTSQQMFNMMLFLGGGFMVFYILIYGTLRLVVAIIGGLTQRADKDASFFDGDGVD